MSEKRIQEAFMKVKNDMNELRADIVKLADRINDLAVEVKEMKKKKR